MGNMHIETERKFLVRGDGFLNDASGCREFRQGHLAREGRTVRVRTDGQTGYLTIKGPSRDGVSRKEWEIGIPAEDAGALLDLCLGSIVEKTRYYVPCEDSHIFEVDVFHGENEGLVVAEVELGSAEEPFCRPAWLGEEVTGQKKYTNAALSVMPYCRWQE